MFSSSCPQCHKTEVLIGEGVLQRLPQRHIGDDGVDILRLLDGVGGDQQQDDADHRVDAEGGAPRGQRGHARSLERADDQRVCHRVDDVSHRLDHADDGQHTQHQPSLRDEVGDARRLGGLVEIDEIVIQHGRKKAHRKLRKAQSYDEGGVDFSHFDPCLLSLM